MHLKRLKNKNAIILIIVCAITLLSAMSHAGGLPGIGKKVIEDLGFNATQLGILLATNHLGIMLFSGWAGYQSDRYPTLYLLILGILLEFFAIIGFALCSNYYLLLLFRLLDGIGFSFVNVAGTRELLRRYPKSLRAFALGVKGTIFPASIMLGSIIVPFMAMQFNWRTALLIASSSPIIALLLASTFFKSTENTPTQTRIKSVSPINAMKTPTVWLLGSIGTVCMLAQNGVVSFLPIFFQKGMDISFSHAIQYLTFIIISGIVGRLLIGYLSCKVLGVRGWLLLIIFSNSICLYLLANFHADMQMWETVPVLVLFGVSLFGWYGSYVALMNSLSTEESIGSFAGIATQFAAVGAIIGPSLTGMLVDLLGYSMAFIIIAFILVVMGLILLAAGRIKIYSFSEPQLRG